MNICLHAEGFANIMEICGPLIQEKSSLLKEIPSSSLPLHIATKFSVEGMSHAGLVSSVATFQGNIVICDSGKLFSRRFEYVLEVAISTHYSKNSSTWGIIISNVSNG